MSAGYRTLARLLCGWVVVLGAGATGVASSMPSAAAWCTQRVTVQPEKQPPAGANPAPTTTPAAPATSTTQPATKPPPEKPAAKPPADPAVDEIIKDLQKPPAAPKTVAPESKSPRTSSAKATEAAKPMTRGPAEAAGAGRAAQPAKTRLVREGTFIVSRRGRVIRNPGGEWLFAFDNGTQNSPTHDPAMVLMPCEKLMALEKVAEKHGEDATFTMSGQVFVYNGRNHLLPTNYVVNRESGEVKPLQ